MMGAPFFGRGFECSWQADGQTQTTMKELVKRYLKIAGLLLVSPFIAHLLFKCWRAEFGIPVKYAAVQPYNPAYAIPGLPADKVTQYRQVDARAFLKANEMRWEVRRLCWWVEFRSLGHCEVEEFVVHDTGRVRVTVTYGKADHLSFLFVKEKGGWRKVPMRR